MEFLFDWVFCDLDVEHKSMGLKVFLKKVLWFWARQKIRKLRD